MPQKTEQERQVEKLQAARREKHAKQKRQAYTDNAKQKQKVFDLYHSFGNHYKKMQAEWSALETNENLQAFKKAGVLGAYNKLGNIVDDEGPMMKKFAMINNAVGGVLDLP